jgi:hypothetical protein
MKINQRCHVCLDDFKLSNSKKDCCTAYICKKCVNELLNNDYDKCPICKDDLDIESNCGCICNSKCIINKEPTIFITLICIYYIVAIIIVTLYQYYN